MRRYAFQVVIQPEPEDPGYLAYSPALPGCFGSGATPAAARRDMRSAITQHLAALRAHGQPIPQDSRPVQVTELRVGVPE